MARALELWASSLRAVKARMAPLFTQERVAASAGLFLDGLLGGERRKTGWMRAEAASDPGPADAVIFHPLLQKSRQATIDLTDFFVPADERLRQTSELRPLPGELGKTNPRQQIVDCLAVGQSARLEIQNSA